MNRFGSRPMAPKAIPESSMGKKRKPTAGAIGAATATARYCAAHIANTPPSEMPLTVTSSASPAAISIAIAVVSTMSRAAQSGEVGRHAVEIAVIRHARE